MVKVETYGERSLALVIGHEDIHKEDHQYVEVNDNLANMYYLDIYLMKDLVLYFQQTPSLRKNVSISRNPSFTNIKNSLKSRF